MVDNGYTQLPMTSLNLHNLIGCLILVIVSSLTFTCSLILTLHPDIFLAGHQFLYQMASAADIFSIELLLHLILSIISLLVILLISVVYICVVHLNPVCKDTLKPVKIMVPESSECNPTCSKKHKHMSKRSVHVVYLLGKIYTGCVTPKVPWLCSPWLLLYSAGQKFRTFYVMTFLWPPCRRGD